MPDNPKWTVNNKPKPLDVEDIEDLNVTLHSVIKAGDLVLTLGAGSIGRVVTLLPDQLREAV